MELILGTASFGLKYGIANDFDQVDQSEATRIIEYSLQNGFSGIDTAQSYGNSESVIGNALIGQLDVPVTSKIQQATCSSSLKIISAIKKTLVNLKRKKIDTILLHDFQTLKECNVSELRNGLLSAIELELVSKIGISVYSEQEVVIAKQLFPELTVFQIPENICDRRSLNSKTLLDLSGEKNEFYVRSVFLQGTLLMAEEDFPKYMSKMGREVKLFQDYLAARDIDPMTACLAYGQSIPWANGLVIGVNSKIQLLQIIEASKYKITLDVDQAPKLSSKWLDPRKW